ncbi:hypothetical protein LLG95_10965 [bacterium]|nr:hypothetical protein [bacterium]
MSERWWTFLAAAVLFAATITPAVMLQDEQIYRFKVTQSQFRDTLYLPNSEYVKAVTIGYDQFTAHFLWLRMIQSFAAGWTRPENAEQMMRYLEVITDLDPHFTEVYRLAMMAVGEKAKRWDLLDRIGEKYFIQNPGRFLVPYEAAYNAFWLENKPTLAKFYTNVALYDPNAPEYIRRQMTYFSMREGSFRVAYEYSLRNYLEAISATSNMGDGRRVDETTKNLFRQNLFRAADGWIRAIIEPVVRKYHEEHGTWPDIDQLDREGKFAGNELPDFGMVFALTEGIRNNQVQKPTREQIDQIVDASIKKCDRLPPSPFAFLKQSMPGYVVWPDSTIPRTASNVADPKNKFELIVSRGEALIEMNRIFGFIMGEAESYRAENKGKMPQSFADFAPQFAKQHDPFGGEYQWDPKTGRPHATGLPDFNPKMVPKLLW